MNTNDKTDEAKRALAAEFKAWRAGTPLADVARWLGMSKRTLEGIEQGRGFAYPALLRLAMNAMDGGANGN